MADVIIDISELKELRDRLLDPVQRDKLMRNTTKSTARFFRKEVRETTPVETGELKKSWGRDNRLDVVKRGSTYSIEHENQAYNPSGEGAYYASFVEEGHWSVAGNWVEAQHFMYDAEVETEQNVKRIFDREFVKWKRWVQRGS